MTGIKTDTEELNNNISTQLSIYPEVVKIEAQFGMALMQCCKIVIL